MEKFNSFTELGKYMGISPVEPRRRNPTRKCRRCGGEMVNIDNTNVYVCSGTKEDGSACKAFALYS